MRVAGQALVARSPSDNWTVQDPAAAAAVLTRIYGFPITLTSKLAGLATVARSLRENDLPKAQIAALLLKFPDPLTGNPSRDERQVLADNLVFSAILEKNLASDAMPEANVERDRGNPLENEMLKNRFDPNQPRDEHGRWTCEDGGSDANAQITDAAYQGEYHDSLAQHEIDQYRKTGGICVSEARLSLGVNTARIDILCRSLTGDLIGVEVKTGDDPKLTLDQVAVYGHSLLGGLSSPDSKILQLGFSPDELLPSFPILIVYAQGPGAPKRFYGPVK